MVCSICRVRNQEIVNCMTALPRGGNFDVKSLKFMYLSKTPLYSWVWISQTKNMYIVMMTKKGLQKILDPWDRVHVQGCGFISYISEFALSSTLSIYNTLIAIVLHVRDYNAVFLCLVYFYSFYDGAVDMLIWAHLTRSQCGGSDTQLAVKAPGPLVCICIYLMTIWTLYGLLMKIVPLPERERQRERERTREREIVCVSECLGSIPWSIITEDDLCVIYKNLQTSKMALIVWLD